MPKWKSWILGEVKAWVRQFLKEDMAVRLCPSCYTQTLKIMDPNSKKITGHICIRCQTQHDQKALQAVTQTASQNLVSIRRIGQELKLKAEGNGKAHTRKKKSRTASKAH